MFVIAQNQIKHDIELNRFGTWTVVGICEYLQLFVCWRRAASFVSLWQVRHNHQLRSRRAQDLHPRRSRISFSFCTIKMSYRLPWQSNVRENANKSYSVIWYTEHPLIYNRDGGLRVVMEKMWTGNFWN